MRVIHVSSLAENKFSDMMMKFIKTVSEQMGVELFVLAGFRNEEGQAMKVRYGCVIIYVEICSMTRTRFETKHANDSQKFSKIFKKHGRDVWEKWDEYLNDLFEGEQTLV
jgi:hypothetical protein